MNIFPYYHAMGAVFSKLQGVHGFVLKMFPANRLKRFKMQLTTMSWHQKHKE
jgi:hypothetical protein